MVEYGYDICHTNIRFAVVLEYGFDIYHTNMRFAIVF